MGDLSYIADEQWSWRLKWPPELIRNNRLCITQISSGCLDNDLILPELESQTPPLGSTKDCQSWYKCAVLGNRINTCHCPCIWCMYSKGCWHWILCQLFAITMTYIKLFVHEVFWVHIYFLKFYSSIHFTYAIWWI